MARMLFSAFRPSPRPGPLVAAAVTISAVATLAGMAALAAFNGTAGVETAGPAHWPAGTAIERSHTAPTVLLFAHPLCTCTGATLEELGKVLAGRRFGVPAPAIRILFSRTDPAWTPGDLWRRAAKIAAVSPVWDEDGKEARIFGVRTSGLVLLYDKRGTLLFEGGITASRGHAGNNYGEERLAAALDSGRRASGLPSRVFGCALFDSRGLEK
jgi:hypothetical protein